MKRKDAQEWSGLPGSSKAKLRIYIREIVTDGQEIVLKVQ